ncbi:MAG: phage/plasmid primase, P4 family [Rubrobacteraceae bacterium]
MSSPKDAAAGYSRRDWCPIPIKKASKQTALAQLAPYLNRPATAEERASWSWPGVGIVTGQFSGVLVLDVDGLEGEAELQKHGHPATPMVRTAGGGLHLYFKHPDHAVKTGIRVAPGLDVKASGGYVVAPPSVGANGNPYEWIVSPEDADLADPPEWLMRLLEGRRFTAPAGPVGERILKGERNKGLASIAGTMRRRGMGEAEILAALQVTNARRCEPPLEAEEVAKIAVSVARYEPSEAGDVVNISVNGHGSPPQPPQFNLTDLGNASRLIAHHGEDLRYCYPWGSWLIWDGRRWSLDESGEIHRRAKRTVREIYREAADAADDETRKALGKHAKASEAENRIQAMISLAKSEVPIMPAAMDANPWLLNVSNGTVDLRTGELLEHRRDDLITKLAGKYGPEASASTWTATLERVLPSAEVRAFFKRLCGYAISGDVSEHVLPVLYGTGANGKSTILNALLEAAGEYGMQAAPDLLIAKRGGHPTEVADLFGMRVVASIEVEDGRRLAEALVKSLTGGDKVRARRMRQDFWQFDPTHTAFLCTNHKPEIRGTDAGIWRRIRLIPFTETIPGAEQDKKLPEKLRVELPGILAWAVEGCLEWQRDGLKAPEEVRKATGAYRSEMDVIGAFLRDECETQQGYSATFKEVYDRYEEWCEEGGEKPETRRKFNARLKERGQFTDRRSGPGGSYEWHGLQLLKKQNVRFAGKLKERSQKDYNELVYTSRSVNSTNNFSSSVTSVDEPVHRDPEAWEGSF